MALKPVKTATLNAVTMHHWIPNPTTQPAPMPPTTKPIDNAIIHDNNDNRMLRYNEPHPNFSTTIR